MKGAIYLLAFVVWMSIVYYGDELWIGLIITSTSSMMLRTRMWCKHIEGCYNYQRGHSAQWDWQPYREDSSCFRSISLSLSLSLSLSHTHTHTHTFTPPSASINNSERRGHQVLGPKVLQLVLLNHLEVRLVEVVGSWSIGNMCSLINKDAIFSWRVWDFFYWSQRVR